MDQLIPILFAPASLGLPWTTWPFKTLYTGAFLRRSCFLETQPYSFSMAYSKRQAFFDP